MSPRHLCALLALVALPTAAADHTHHPKHSPEHRTALKMTAAQKAHIHLEMRLFLAATGKIVSAAAANDMKTVATAAREAGMAAAHEVPAELRRNLPLQFKQLGHATHSAFDDLARDAESLGDANHALRQLGALLSNCVSCHAVYRIETR